MTKEKLAIIGGGISGLSAACILQDRFAVTLFEKEKRLGGHARTISVPSSGGPLPVDTGFIVYNERNYPHLTKFFAHYKVPTEDSCMSFGVDIRPLGLSYASTSIPIPSRNWLKPQFWGMLKDILRFNRIGTRFLDAPLSLTLGAFLKEQKFGTWFCEYYLKPMGAAIWSCPLKTIEEYPAATFLRFFDNHGLLTVFDQPDWRTVSGGSISYIKILRDHLSIEIKEGTGITNVKRSKKGVTLTDTHGKTHLFDQVLFACHADETLSTLTDADAKEKDILSAFRFQPNHVVVHTDESLMPRQKRDWASWVYLAEESESEKDDVSLSYWMNNLQNLPASTPVFITLNPARMPREEMILDRNTFSHPVFTPEAVTAQGKLDEIQGQGGIWYAGAWTRYGFHEDGILSAVRVAEKMGITPPWM